jgi:hypothetical protein
MGLDGIVSCVLPNFQPPHSDDEWMMEAHFKSLINVPIRCESDPGPEPLEDPCTRSVPDSKEEVVLADSVNVSPAFCEVHEASTSFSVPQTDRSFSCGVIQDDSRPARDVQFSDDVPFSKVYSDQVQEFDISQAAESISSGVFQCTASDEVPVSSSEDWRKVQESAVIPVPVSHAECTQGDSLSPHPQELPIGDSE